MAKDDYFVIVFKVLAYLYAVLTKMIHQNQCIVQPRYFDLVIKGRTDYIRIDDTKVAERFIWYIARNNR